MDTQQLIERLYGVRTYKRKNFLTNVVGLTPVRIAPAHPGRVSLHINNNSGGYVMLWDTPQVAATLGYRIVAHGGIAVFEFQNDFSTVTDTVWAIAEFAASNISVVEIIMLGGN